MTQDSLFDKLRTIIITTGDSSEYPVSAFRFIAGESKFSNDDTNASSETPYLANSTNLKAGGRMRESLFWLMWPSVVTSCTNQAHRQTRRNCSIATGCHRNVPMVEKVER